MRLGLAGALLCCPPVSAQGLHVDDWGVYGNTHGRLVPDPGSTAGIAEIGPEGSLLLKTHDLCAEIGTEFGFRFSFDTPPPAAGLGVTVDVHHPPMRNHFGGLQRIDRMEMTVDPGSRRFAGWSFHDSHRLVPGLWRFVVRSGDTVLLEQRFTVRVGCAPPVS